MTSRTHVLRLFGSMAMLTWALSVVGCASPAGPREPMADLPTVAEAAAAASASAAARAAAPAASAASAPVATVELPATTDPLRPDVRIDLEDRRARVDLWARIREGYKIPELETPLVKTAEKWYATRPDYVQRMTERGSRYLFYIVEEIERRGMPTELALLPFIESAYNPEAMSVARASGMWQFVPATGRDYDLRQNVFRDDRRDVLASTRAALDYLQRLHDMFGDWQLALAAYNCGEGNVQRAIKKNQKRGLPTDYVNLKLPRETLYYVPKLQAVKNIVRQPSQYSLTLPTVSNHPYFLSVGITRDIDVALAAKLADLSLEEFKTLNPQMNKPVILAAGTPQILLPYDNANRFVRAIAQHNGPTSSWTAWVAPKTVRPAEAAKQIGWTESDLREVNQIPPRMLVKAGSTLLVPRSDSAAENISNEIADNGTMALAPDGPALRRTTIKAGKRGESVASVAKRYRVSAAVVAQWNNTSAAASFKPGQAITVYVPARASHGKKSAKSSGKRKSSAAKRSPPKKKAVR